MANQTHIYRISWSWKEEGNRQATGHWSGKATTVPRAVSKLVKELNEQAKTDGEDPVKASELMILDVRSMKFNG